jgi:manganese efflux pump family protein
LDLVSILLIALGLSLDAFAVAVSAGIRVRPVELRFGLTIAAFFGSFQAIMPVLGWLAGIGLRGLITGVDHWVAFLLLAAVGGRMIYESFSKKESKPAADPRKIPVLLMLAVATSIDALAVGIGFSFIKAEIFRPAAIIGLVTFSLSLIGVYAGKKVGRWLNRRVDLVGGLILVLIGIKILIEHLR